MSQYRKILARKVTLQPKIQPQCDIPLQNTPTSTALLNDIMSKIQCGQLHSELRM